jgi:Uncharacterized conserved protein (DUF2075)
MGGDITGHPKPCRVVSLARSKSLGNRRALTGASPNSDGTSSMPQPMLNYPLLVATRSNRWSNAKRSGRMMGIPSYSKPGAEFVKLDGFSVPWNAMPDVGKLAPGIPKSNFWASDPNGINQVGCVYTAQGFEFDYVGVIFGRDLVYDAGWRATARSRTTLS